MLTREQKEQQLEVLKSALVPAAGLFVVDFTGLTVAEVTELRRKVKEAQGNYLVVKNTLARLAFSQTPHNVLGEKLKYSCAVAFGYDDPVVAAKVVVEFAKKNDKFSVRCASLNGKLLDEAAVKALSDLPSREQLLAQVLGTMNAVPQNFVCLFANVLRGMLNVLSALKEKKEQE
jgi:large subunit ribosomal protein L10